MKYGEHKITYSYFSVINNLNPTLSVYLLIEGRNLFNQADN
jgi:hypothetical protein